MEKSCDSEEYFDFLEGCYQNPVVLVEISSVCNFQCVYCVSKLKKREKGFMSPELFEHIVQQLPKITPYPVRLHIDGEPTIHPKFYEFGKLLNQKGIPFVVATNGSRLSPKFLDLEMDVLISISTQSEEFKLRTQHINFDDYLSGIIEYLRSWLVTDSKQHIYIQIPYYPEGENETYTVQKNEFIKTIERQLDVEKYTAKKEYSSLGAEYCYIKPNGYLLLFYKWSIASCQIYKQETDVDIMTKKGFCSAPWQELAIMWDGRVSFCCTDLTGGTAITSKKEIWTHSLLDLWLNNKITKIRRNFKNREVQLEICQRCLGGIPGHMLYANDHQMDTIFIPKPKDRFPIDSLGLKRDSQSFRGQTIFQRTKKMFSSKLKTYWH